ncbi:MAG: hypothetical protein KIS74_04645 [Burkholderiales bacterium]|nr:hypothetical protein [Burkholderiales bacterium]MCW5941886.1 hypothetical protein [Fimbriimonadaceae bacterium]
MLDHVNWYLVELEQRLRNRRSAQATTDMLLETRAHLDERVAELTAKGLDPTSAAKAAITDFGDPDAVVRAYSGSLGVRPIAYRVWLIVAALLALCGVEWLGAELLNPERSYPGSTYIFLCWVLAGTIPALLALRTRRWASVPVVAVGMAAALLGSIYTAASSAFIEWNGERRVMHEPVRAFEAAARMRWVRAFDADMARIEAWRAAPAGATGDRLLQDLIAGSNYVAPVRVGGYPWDRRQALPSLAGSRAEPLRPLSYHPGYVLNAFGSFNAAKAQWLQTGDAYANFLRTERETVRAELLATSTPIIVPFGERWLAMGAPLATVSGLASLLILLANGLAIGWVDLVRQRRRSGWRRQVG